VMSRRRSISFIIIFMNVHLLIDILLSEKRPI